MAYYTDKAFSSNFLANSKGLDEMIVRNKASEYKEDHTNNIGASRSFTSSMPRDSSLSYNSSSTFSSRNNDSSRQSVSEENKYASYKSYRDPLLSKTTEVSLPSFRR